MAELSLATSSRVGLMFFSKHAQRDENRLPEVTLLCKCFSKIDVVPKTVFTKKFRSEEDFKAFVRSNPCDVNVADLDRVDNALVVKNVVTGATVPNKTLVTAQTNIFLALNKNLAKCGSDPVKSYLFTAARLLVGEGEEEMPHTFTNLKAFLNQYYAASKCLKITHANPSDDVFTLYDRVFGGDKVFEYISFAREALSAAILATKRLEEVYDQYNSDRCTVSCNSVSYANLEYFCAMGNRFRSVLDILTGDKKCDGEHLEEYQTKVRTVVDSGARYIREYIKNTVKYTHYDPKKHTGYEVDETFKGAHGVTQPSSCGQISKDILKKDLFPESISRRIKGTSVHQISQLCNSDRRTIMSGELVKDLLRDKHDIPTDTAFVGIQTPHGFSFSRLLNPAQTDKEFTTVSTVTTIKSHVSNPSMVSYNRYSRELKVAPQLTMNELINPRMTVFTLSLDIDSKELVKQFYSSTNKDTWSEREAILKVMRETMRDFTKVTQRGREEEEFVCCMYESRPDSANTDKVGLRVVYKFKRLVFKNTDVLRRFIRAFKFFLSRRAPVLGYAIDDAMYASGRGGKMLRLPCMWKIKNGKPTRQLIGVMDKMSRSFVPSYGLVHHKHTYLAKEGPVKVMTDIGDIESLIKTPQDAEFNLLKAKNSRKRKYERVDEVLSDRFTTYLTSIMEDTLMPAVHSLGGGFEEDRLTGVKRRVAGDRVEYTLTPTIRWCTKKRHTDPKGNPCRYFVTLNDNDTFSLGMMCFGCGFDRNIHVGDLPS